MIRDARRRRRRRVALVVLAALALLGGLALVMASVSGRGDPRLNASGPSPAALAARRSGEPTLELFPAIEGGQAGWCYTIFEPTGGGGGSCGPLATSANALFSEGTSEIPPALPRATAITAPDVARVRFSDRRTVATRPIAGGEGMRIAEDVMPRPRSARQEDFETHVTVSGLFAADGRRLAIAGQANHDQMAGFEGPYTSAFDRASILASGAATWIAPHRAPATAPCSIRVSMAGAVAEWGRFAKRLAPPRGTLYSPGFLSCADTVYVTSFGIVEVAVLLDAAHPGRSEPAPIPGLVPIAGRPGYFRETGRLGRQRWDSVARRDGKAWILALSGIRVPGGGLLLRLAYERGTRTRTVSHVRGGLAVKVQLHQKGVEFVPVPALARMLSATHVAVRV